MSVQTSTGLAARRRRDWAALAPRVIAQPWVWVGALTLVGLLLRRYHLGNESLWFDEADIAQRAHQSLPALLDSFTKAGENGPLYTLMLHFWLSALDASSLLVKLAHVAFGHTDEALVRGPSALFGAAAIPLIYMLGRRVGGITLGFVSAALLTFNPFDIWHSQDAKMYTLLVLMTLITSLLYLAAWERNSPRLWLAYVLTTWLSLTIHSMAALVFLAQLAVGILDFGFWILDFRRTQAKIQNPKSKIRWAWAMLLVMAPALPIAWLRAAALVAGTDVGGWYTPTGLGDILSTIFVKFAVNQAPPPWELIGAITVGALALLGVFWILDFRFWIEDKNKSKIQNPKSKIGVVQNPKSKWLLLALWVVPVFVFWLVTLKVPLFQPRYLIMALPSYLILAGAGLLALRRVHPLAPVLATVLLAASTIAALLGVNYSPTPQKEDWRGAVGYVQDHLRLRDSVIVFPGYMVTAVRQYYRPGGVGNVPQVDVKAVPSLSTKGFGDVELNAWLLRTLSCHERAWLVTSPIREAQEDPQGKVLAEFQGNWHTFDTKVFNGVTVYGIAFNGQPNCWYPEADHKERHSFTNGLDFLGYIYELRNEDNPQPDASYFPFTMYWHNLAKLDQDYIMRVVIKDPSGKMVVDDALGPLNGYWPTSQWPANIQVIDYRDLRLPGGLSPGNYTVAIQVYPKGQPDQPLTLKDGGTWIELKQPLPVAPWRGQ